MWYKKAQKFAKDVPQIEHMIHDLPAGFENYAEEMAARMPTPTYAQGKVLEYIKNIFPLENNAFRVPKLHDHCHCELVEVGTIPATGEKIYYWRTNPTACGTCLQMAQVYNQASMDYLEDLYPKQGAASGLPVEEPLVPPATQTIPELAPQPQNVEEPVQTEVPEQNDEELLNKILEPQDVQENKFIVQKLRTRPFKSFV